MKKKRPYIVINIRIGRAQAVALGALAVLCAATLELRSTTVDVHAIFPSPAGIYQALTTTAATLLARDTGSVIMAPRGNPSIGIGTPAPVGNMNVHNSVSQGNVVVSGVSDSGSTFSGYYLYDSARNTNNGWVVAFRNMAGTAFQNALHFIRFTAGVGSIYMNIQPGGNVGINNGGPQERLDVWGNVLAHDYLVRSLQLNGIPYRLTNMHSRTFCLDMAELQWHHGWCNNPAAQFTPGCIAACNRHCAGQFHGTPGPVWYAGGTQVEGAGTAVCCLCSY